MKYFAAVDQGGSKTEALVFNDAGEILAFGDDRSIRKPGESYAKMQGAWIAAAVTAALNKLKLSLSDLSGVSCALNGADWDEDYPRLQQLVMTHLHLPADSVLIFNDCIGAMRGGDLRLDGNVAVLCMGTGMNAAVRAADRREYIYGYYLNAPDQGGGALGTRAWQSMIDAHNGFIPPTLITDFALKRYGMYEECCIDGKPDMEGLYKKFTTNQIFFRNHDFCPILMQAAKAGDAAAQNILEEFCSRVLRYITAGAQRLGIEREAITLICTGNVFKGDGQLFFELITQQLLKIAPNIQCIPAKYEPVAGTALLLLDHLNAGSDQPQQIFRNFDLDARRFGLIRS